MKQFLLDALIVIVALAISAAFFLDSFVFAMPAADPLTGESPACTTALGFSSDSVRAAERLSPLVGLALAFTIIVVRRRRGRGRELQATAAAPN